MSHTDPIVIVGAARTPMGSFQGDFSALAAHDLGAAVIRAAVERAGIAPQQVDEVLMGNCLMAGQGQAPARQAALEAALPKSAGAVTLSEMCGAGMRAATFAHDMLAAGSAEVVYRSFCKFRFARWEAGLPGEVRRRVGAGAAHLARRARFMV